MTELRVQKTARDVHNRQKVNHMMMYVLYDTMATKSTCKRAFQIIRIYAVGNAEARSEHGPPARAPSG